MENNAILSLETHLFFARIMKEHSFFLEAGCDSGVDNMLTAAVDEINRRAIRLLDGLIDFKENILEEVKRGRIFTFNILF